MVMAETGSGDSNYHEYIENVYVLSETLDGYEEISRTDGKRSNFFEYSNSVDIPFLTNDCLHFYTH